MKLIRLIGLALAAVATEIAKGFGAAAFLGALFLGWRGAGFVWALVLALAGAALSQGAAHWGGDKVDHALSNWLFAAMIYFALCLAGFGAGRAVRYLQRPPSPPQPPPDF